MFVCPWHRLPKLARYLQAVFIVSKFLEDLINLNLTWTWVKFCNFAIFAIFVINRSFPQTGMWQKETCRCNISLLFFPRNHMSPGVYRTSDFSQDSGNLSLVKFLCVFLNRITTVVSLWKNNPIATNYLKMTLKCLHVRAS